MTEPGVGRRRTRLFPRAPWRWRLTGGLAAMLALAPLALGAGSPTARRRARNFAAPLTALRFEANRGQTNSRVDFLARGRGYTLFLLPGEAVLALRSQKSEARSQKSRRPSGADHGLPGTTDPSLWTTGVLHLQILGASPRARAAGADELPGRTNYFVGRNPARWRTNIPSFARVRYANVYPGIDLVYYGKQGRLEYDWVVKPGANPASIVFRVGTGGFKIQNSKCRIAANGDLLIETAAGEVRLQKPTVYQPAARTREAGGPEMGSRAAAGNSPSPAANAQVLDGRYVLMAGNRVRFAVSGYDRARPLVIDPVLTYSTYLGGSSGDAGFSIAADTDGNVYVAGSTSSPDFPPSARSRPTRAAAPTRSSPSSTPPARRWFIPRIWAATGLTRPTAWRWTAPEMST